MAPTKQGSLTLFALLAGVLVALILLEAWNVTWVFNYKVLTMLKGSLGGVASLLSFSAGIAVTAIILLYFVVADIVARRDISGLTCRLVAAIIFSMLLVAVLKALLEIPRPSGTYIRMGFPKSLLSADMYAFPSGHATRAAVLSWFLVRKWKVFAVIAPVYVLAVCFSRVALAAHWPMDVVAGVVLGVWSSQAVELVGYRIDKICRIVCGKVSRCGPKEGGRGAWAGTWGLAPVPSSDPNSTASSPISAAAIGRHIQGGAVI